MSEITNRELRQHGYFGHFYANAFDGGWYVVLADFKTGHGIKICKFKELDWSDVMDQLAVDFATRRLKGEL